MQSQLPLYRPSGRFKPLAGGYALGAVLAGTLAGGVYQFAANLLPVLELRVGLVVLLGLAAFGLTTSVIDKGHVRGRGLALGVAGATALSMLLASYAWEYLDAVRALLAAHPELTLQDVLEGFPVGRWVRFRVEHGWTSTRNGSTQYSDGLVVYAAWLAEALFVFACALGPAWGRAVQPYCEHCAQWMSPAEGFRLLGLGREMAQPLLDAGDLTSLLALQSPLEAEDTPRLSFISRACSTCKDTLLSVNEGRLKKGLDGQLSIAYAPLVEHALLSPEQRKQLRARALEQEQAYAAAEASAA